MSTQNDYTKRELELMFQRLEEMLRDINTNIKENHTRFELSISDLQKESVRVEKKIDRIATIGGTVWAAVTLLSGYILQKLF